MAEIRIERKTRKKPVWPWVLLLLLILGIIAWLMLADEPSELGAADIGTVVNYHLPSSGKIALGSVVY